jgi:hypothetical protein
MAGRKSMALVQSFCLVNFAGRPKEARLALWIDNLGFYRHKQPDAGLEAGP